MSALKLMGESPIVCPGDKLYSAVCSGVSGCHPHCTLPLDVLEKNIKSTLKS